MSKKTTVHVTEEKNLQVDSRTVAIIFGFILACIVVSLFSLKWGIMLLALGVFIVSILMLAIQGS